MFKVFYNSGFERDIKKLDKKTILVIKDEIEKIAKSPYDGQFLHGEFRKYRKCKVKYKNVSYRIFYQIYSKDRKINLILVNTRENIYKELKKRIR